MSAITSALIDQIQAAVAELNAASQDEGLADVSPRPSRSPASAG